MEIGKDNQELLREALSKLNHDPNPYTASSNDTEILDRYQAAMSTQDIVVGLFMTFLLGFATGTLVVAFQM